MEGIQEMQAGGDLVSRLELAASLLERTLGWLEEAQREIATLRAAAGATTAVSFPRALEPLRKTLPSATAEMLAKHGIGESAVDVLTLDAALAGLSLEQRIAVKSQLRRAGAMA